MSRGEFPSVASARRPPTSASPSGKTGILRQKRAKSLSSQAARRSFGSLSSQQLQQKHACSRHDADQPLPERSNASTDPNAMLLELFVRVFAQATDVFPCSRRGLRMSWRSSSTRLPTSSIRLCSPMFSVPRLLSEIVTSSSCPRDSRPWSQPLCGAPPLPTLAPEAASPPRQAADALPIRSCHLRTAGCSKFLTGPGGCQGKGRKATRWHVRPRTREASPRRPKIPRWIPA